MSRKNVASTAAAGNMTGRWQQHVLASAYAAEAAKHRYASALTTGTPLIITASAAPHRIIIVMYVGKKQGATVIEHLKKIATII